MRIRALLFVLVLSGCTSPSQSRSECDPQDESEFAGGFLVRGLSVNTGGRGYLTTTIGYGCLETFVSRLYAIDVATRTATPLELDFSPGKVLATGDGTRALMVGSRDELGLVGNAPSRAVFIDGLTMTSIPLGSPAWDIVRGDGGWLAVAGSSGAWWIDEDTIAAEQLPVQAPNFCGTIAGRRRLVCSGEEIAVLDSSGSLVTSLVLPEAPSYLVGAQTAAIALAGTNAYVVIDDVVDRAIPLTSPATRAWLAADSRFALAQGPGLLHWIDLEGDLVTTAENTVPLTDVEFRGDIAIFTYGDVGSIGTHDFSTGAVEFYYALPPRLPFDQVEKIGDTVFLIASSYPGAGWEPEDVAEQAFVTFDLSTESFGEYWGVPNE